MSSFTRGENIPKGNNYLNQIVFLFERWVTLPRVITIQIWLNQPFKCFLTEIKGLPTWSPLAVAEPNTTTQCEVNNAVWQRCQTHRK